MKKPSIKTHRLLSRTDFREAVLARDNHRCVNCGNSGKLDAHHIIERRLFDDGGYYLENGATLCDDGGCHRLAEQTILGAQELRDKIGIDRIVLPDQLYADSEYTKWGDIIQKNGRRTRGELFYDESVQAILKESNVLDLYDTAVRYPRTNHLPYSPGITSSDRVLKDTSCFEGQHVTVTLKMDGENTTLSSERIHARSLEGAAHPSQTYVRGLHGRIAHDIPAGYRLIVENLYAVHSIQYEDLKDYVYLISVWNNKNECLSWDDTVEYAEIFGLPTVPVMYEGIFDEEKIAAAYEPLSKTHEGYVVRKTDSFTGREFRTSVAKWVRPNHVNQDHHNWKFGWYENENTVNKKISL